VPKVIGFIGSPREEGNTATIIEEIAEVAKQQGAEVKLYHLNTMSFKPCQGCFKCRQADTCTLDDEMQQVYKDLKDAGALIIGSPIYMGQVSGQTKAFLDRLFPIIGPDFKPRFGTKKTVLVFSQGRPEPEAYKGYIETLASDLKLLGLEVTEILICTGANDPRKAKTDSQLLAKAREVARMLVSA